MDSSESLRHSILKKNWEIPKLPVRLSSSFRLRENSPALTPSNLSGGSSKNIKQPISDSKFAQAEIRQNHSFLIPSALVPENASKIQMASNLLPNIFRSSSSKKYEDVLDGKAKSGLTFTFMKKPSPMIHMSIDDPNRPDEFLQGKIMERFYYPRKPATIQRRIEIHPRQLSDSEVFRPMVVQNTPQSALQSPEKKRLFKQPSAGDITVRTVDKSLPRLERRSAYLKSPNKGYYMDSLFRVLFEPAAADRDQRLNEFLKHCIANYKILSLMMGDSFQDEEEYLHKIELRALVKDVLVSPVGRRLDKPLLVLDLDETLIHSPQDQSVPCLVVQRIQTDANSASKIVGFNVRPHASEFLHAMSERFTIYVFSASSADYAQAVVAYLDPTRRCIKRVFDRRFCMATKKGYLVKDLRILRDDCKIKHMLLVDNSIYCFFPQLKNGVPILPFLGDQSDTELYKLKEYLLELSGSPDTMVQRNEQYFGLHKYAPGQFAQIYERLFQ